MIKKILFLSWLLVSFTSCDSEHKVLVNNENSLAQQSAIVNLSAPGLLRKISFHIRGKKPTHEEYQSLFSDDPYSSKEVIYKWTKNYLQSENHRKKIIFRLQETMQLKPIDSSFEDSFSNLIDDVVRNNLSWDVLFTKKSYIIKDEERFFFESAKPKEIPDGLGNTKIEFNENDERIAGVITTPRFFNRYINTITNQNRRRAAALFKIMLCKDFRTVLESSSEMEKEIFKIVYPTKKNRIAEHDVKILSQDTHGTNPSCVKCHRQLDPMGKTFRGIADKLSKFPTPGALVLEADQKKEIFETTNAKGLGELVEMITKSEAFARCQTQIFWDWFIGVDVPLSEKRHKEIMKEFNKNKHRVNDFIFYLLNQNEFKQIEVNSLINYKSISKRALKNCDTCHTSKIPKFEVWPIGGSFDTHKFWLSELTRVLDLKGFGLQRTMPPKNSFWQPSSSEIQALTKWVEAGGNYE